MKVRWIAIIIVPALLLGAAVLAYALWPAVPDNPTTVYPTSGYWRYTMSAAADNINCDIGSFGAMTASGQVQLVMADYGFSADLITDNAVIHLNRLQYQATDYESPSYSFPLLDGYGEVQFNFTALDQAAMTGTLQVTGDRCVAEYPLTMELEIPTVPPLYIPGQGNWTIGYGPMVCGATVLSPATLPLPLGIASLTVTGGGPIPMLLAFSGTTAGTPGSLQLNQQSLESNNYTSIPNLYLGTATDPITGLPVSLSGTLSVTALSATQLMGTLIVQGSNGCVAASMMQFQQ